jgi:hypothetical protein
LHRQRSGEAQLLEGIANCIGKGLVTNNGNLNKIGWTTLMDQISSAPILRLISTAIKSKMQKTSFGRYTLTTSSCATKAALVANLTKSLFIWRGDTVPHLCAMSPSSPMTMVGQLH